jgi:hypothetical protein
MADSRQVAEQLREFVDAARNVKAPPRIPIIKGGYQVQVASGMNPPALFRERTEVYEACIAKLDEPDRIELARILATMFDALGTL